MLSFNKNRPRLPNTSENLKAFFELGRRSQIQSVCSRLTKQAASSSGGEGRGVRWVPALSSVRTRLPAHGRAWLLLCSSCSSILGTAATPGSAAARSPQGRSAKHLPGRAEPSPEPGWLWGRRLQLAACRATHLAAQPAPRAVLSHGCALFWAAPTCREFCVRDRSTELSMGKRGPAPGGSQRLPNRAAASPEEFWMRTAPGCLDFTSVAWSSESPWGAGQSMRILIFRQKRGPAAWSAPEPLPGASIQGSHQKADVEKAKSDCSCPCLPKPVCIPSHSTDTVPETWKNSHFPMPVAQKLFGGVPASAWHPGGCGVPAATSPCCPCP